MNNNRDNVEINEIYPRDLFLCIRSYFDSKEIIAVMGSRQSGKTTLLKIIFNELRKTKQCVFLTFEKKDDLEIFDSDIENFKKLFVDPYEVIFIDEFQYAKEAGKKLKYLYDTSGKKFFISGSSSLEIKEAGKYLVGRVFAFYLHPFSFSEFVRAKNVSLYDIISPAMRAVRKIVKGGEKTLLENPLKSSALQEELKKLFSEYVCYGGYPRVVVAKSDEEKKIVLSSILDNYLLREIRSLIHLATEDELIQITRLLALQIGNLVSYQELSNASNLSYEQVKKHLLILRQTFIINLVTPYFKNKRKELVKNPKVYFLDSGFRNKMINNFMSLESRADAGALAENFMFAHLYYGENSDISRTRFWRTKSQAEVDFIVEREGDILPIEVKYTPLKNITLGKSVISFVKKYSPRAAIITTSDNFGTIKFGSTTVYFIPLFYLGASYQ